MRDQKKFKNASNDGARKKLHEELGDDDLIPVFGFVEMSGRSMRWGERRAE